MSLKNDLKSIITKQGFTIKQVNDELNRRHGTDYTSQNFSNRLRKETFSYNEIVEILNVIGYKIKWEKY